MYLKYFSYRGWFVIKKIKKIIILLLKKNRLPPLVFIRLLKYSGGLLLKFRGQLTLGCDGWFVILPIFCFWVKVYGLDGERDIQLDNPAQIWNSCQILEEDFLHKKLYRTVWAPLIECSPGHFYFLKTINWIGCSE